MAKKGNVMGCAVYEFSDFGKKIEKFFGTFDVEIGEYDCGLEKQNFIQIRDGIKRLTGTDKPFRLDGIWTDGVVKSSFRGNTASANFHRASAKLFNDAHPKYGAIEETLIGTPRNTVESSIGFELFQKGYMLHTGIFGTTMMGTTLPLAVSVLRTSGKVRFDSVDYYVKPIEWWAKSLQGVKGDILKRVAQSRDDVLYSLIPSHEAYDATAGLSPKRAASANNKKAEAMAALCVINTAGARDIPEYPPHIVEEAVSRMRSLSLDEATISLFVKGRLTMNGADGIPRRIDTVMRESVRKAINEGYYPYCTLTNDYETPHLKKAFRADTMLCVSADKDEWAAERYNKFLGSMHAVCPTIGFNSVLDNGLVGIRSERGLLFRTF